jgi:predicted transcriptional regulator
MPTQAELEILQILWAEQPCTVRTLHERILAGGKSVGYTTVLKQVQRLVDKGALEREIVDRVHYFRANASENQVKEQLAGKIMHTAFGGSALHGHARAGQSEAQFGRIGGTQNLARPTIF